MPMPPQKDSVLSIRGLAPNSAVNEMDWKEFGRTMVIEFERGRGGRVRGEGSRRNIVITIQMVICDKWVSLESLVMVRNTN